MKKLLTLFLLLHSGSSIGQNLIPNGDFEQYLSCPTNPFSINFSKFWFQPTYGSSDYFNECDTGWANVPNTKFFGFQQARSGIAFAGLYSYIPSSLYREYIECPISSTIYSLVANECYQFKMYINLGNNSIYTCSNIGVYFSNERISDTTSNSILPLEPQIKNVVGNYPDTLNWTLVSGEYIAHGGEKYIVLGNFDSENLIDALYINNEGNNPATYVFIDDVSLTPCNTTAILNLNNESIINIFPNPVKDKLSIEIKNYEKNEITIYNLLSIKVLQHEFINTTSLNIEQLERGIYLYEIKSRDGIIKKGKLIKD